MRNKLFKLAVMTCKLTLKVSWLLVNYGVQFTVWCFILLATREKKTPKKQHAVKEYPPTKTYHFRSHPYEASRCRNSSGKIMYRKVYRDSSRFYINYLNHTHTVAFNVQSQTWEL